MTGKGSEGAFWGDGNVLCFELGIVYTDAYDCQKKKNHWTIYFKLVHFSVCKLYFNKVDFFKKGSWAEEEHSN